MNRKILLGLILYIGVSVAHAVPQWLDFEGVVIEINDTQNLVPSGFDLGTKLNGFLAWESSVHDSFPLNTGYAAFEHSGNNEQVSWIMIEGTDYFIDTYSTPMVWESGSVETNDLVFQGEVNSSLQYAGFNLVAGDWGILARFNNVFYSDLPAANRIVELGDANDAQIVVRRNIVDPPLFVAEITKFRVAKYRPDQLALRTEFNNGTLTFRWRSSPGQAFRLECTPDLKQWTTIGDDMYPVRRTAEATVDLTQGSAGLKFYRLKQIL